MKGVLFLMAAILVIAGVKLTGQQTLLQQAALAADADFQSRVKMAAVAVGYSVSLEDAAGGGQCVGRMASCPERRKALATVISNSPDTWKQQLAVVAAADATITSGSTDQALKDRLYQAWNLLAGS